MITKKSALPKADTQITELLAAENARQQNTINLIASENYTSAAIRAAVGSTATNKYAEGYPGKRYYAGCAIVDTIEQVAIDRCKELFKAEAANVQPHAGSPANFSAYTAVLKPGDTILGMSLAHGGHLTHGHPVNLSGSLYHAVSYGVDPATELIDYQLVEELATKHRPRLIIAGASAYSRIIDFERFAQIARKVGAYFMADIAHIAGPVAAGLHPSPIAYADLVTSTTHKTLRGPRGGIILSKHTLKDAVDRAIMPGTQGGPFMNVIAGKATCFYEALQPQFVEYQRMILETAKQMALSFQNRGYRIVSGGTDNHLFIIDLTGSAYTGKAAEELLEAYGITVSRSCIPNDTRKPSITSGIRIGTPAMVTRGMTPSEAEMIVEYIDTILRAPKEQHPLEEVKGKITNLAQQLLVP